MTRAHRNRLSATFAIAALAIVATMAAPSASAPVAAAAGCNPSQTYIPTAPPGCERRRYARETVLLPWERFIARKRDFTNAGCNPDDPRPDGCTKPRPYERFNWTTDGCSKTPPHLARRFNGPCQQHDFGYRNFGTGLTLERTEDRRAWIDARFRTEMYRICSGFGVSAGNCRVEAQTMWSAVRRFNTWQS